MQDDQLIQDSQRFAPGDYNAGKAIAPLKKMARKLTSEYNNAPDGGNTEFAEGDVGDDQYSYDNNFSGDMSASKKSRGNYRCKRCGQPKKGHMCPFEPHFRKRDNEKGEADAFDVEIQVELDPDMVVRLLPLDRQGYADSYIIDTGHDLPPEAYHIESENVGDNDIDEEDERGAPLSLVSPPTVIEMSTPMSQGGIPPLPPMMSGMTLPGNR